MYSVISSDVESALKASLGAAIGETDGPPLILTLARGPYCPKEHQQHLELAAFYPKIAVDPEHNPMIPHTLVLKPGLVIYSIYSGYWFWGRPSVVDLWHDLRAVTREIRPDWDLSTPGLREA